MREFTRREFLGCSLTAAAGIALAPRVSAGTTRTYTGVLEAPKEGYPLVEAAGSHREIGLQIGTAMKERITGHLELSSQYADSREYLEGHGAEKVTKMFALSQEHFPHLIEEIEGMAEALEIPMMALFAFQCKAEISILKDPPGCSTIALCEDGRVILAHNEDGNDLNIGRMFLARVTPPSGVTFLAFVYPGLLPGNGPSFNDRGIVQTTNYIQPRGVPEGIPRYIIGRQILEAKTLDEAVALATKTPRAFSYHHNLVSLTEGRYLSVETAAYPEQKHSVKKIEGLYVHTNHFLHDTMDGDGSTSTEPREFDVPYESSTTRMSVLSRAIDDDGPPVDEKGILKLLALHKGRPYSPCRHPEGDVHGATLGTAIFKSPDKTMTLYHGNPCRGNEKRYSL